MPTTCPTVRIDDGHGGFLTINAEDFDASVHTLYGETPPKKTRVKGKGGGKKAKAEPEPEPDEDEEDDDEDDDEEDEEGEGEKDAKPDETPTTPPRVRRTTKK